MTKKKSGEKCQMKAASPFNSFFSSFYNRKKGKMTDKEKEQNDPPISKQSIV
jgi:hypothetical protein